MLLLKLVYILCLGEFSGMDKSIGYNIEHMTSSGIDLTVIVHIFLDAIKCTP